MRRFIVLGLGHFGFNVAKKLFENGKEVIAIDIDRNVVQSIKEFATQAIVADASDKDVLESVGAKDADVAVISLGDRLDTNILATFYLKEMGVTEIVAKVLTEDHAKVLKTIGATDVIFPDRDMAIRLAERLSNPNVLDQIEFMEGYSVVEIEAPPIFYGITLEEAKIRNKYELTVVLIKRGSDQVLIAPKAEDKIEMNDVLVLLGEDSKIESFKEIAYKNGKKSE